MRQFLCVFLLSILCLGSGCKRSESSWNKENGKVKVLTTIAMIDDIISQVGKEHVESITLIKGELDPHTYELVKGDDEKFARADLIFYNGLSLEHGFSLRHNLENNPKAIALGDLIYQEDPKLILKIDNQFDPHIWMDISLWMRIVDPICDALVKKDPLHAEEYQQNARVLKERMKEADSETYKIMQSIPSEKRYLVTSHNAFHYFVRRYLTEPKEVEENNWVMRLAAPEGLAPAAELSVADIQRVLNYVKGHDIHVLFPESNLNKDALKKIVSVGKEKGISLHLSEKTLYADSMGRETSYLKMIDHNVRTIAEELNARE